MPNDAAPPLHISDLQVRAGRGLGPGPGAARLHGSSSDRLPFAQRRLSCTVPWYVGAMPQMETITVNQFRDSLREQIEKAEKSLIELGAFLPWSMRQCGRVSPGNPTLCRLSRQRQAHIDFVPGHPEATVRPALHDRPFQ